jgi:ribosomal-protein-alanine N-acetyltransferase
METRIVLKPPTDDDRDDFLAAMHASRDLHDPWVYPPLTTMEYALYLKRLARVDNPGFLVRLRNGGQIVGVINFNHIVHGGIDSAFLGYYAVAGFTGNGYMTEGLQIAMEYGFSRLSLHRLEANIQPGNRRSIALVKRCGFRYEGFSPRYMKIGAKWCDHERWAITVEEWKEQRRSRV